MLKRLLPISLIGISFFSCKEPGYGSLTINLKDGPADLDEINIDLQGIEIYIEGQNKSEWHKLHTNKGIYNILLFQTTSALVATQSKIPEGKVSMVKLVLGDNNSVRENEAYHPLITQHATGDKFFVMIPADFLVSADKMLNVLLDIDAERSVTKNAQGRYLLHPVAVSGIVNSPMDIN